MGVYESHENYGRAAALETIDFYDLRADVMRVRYSLGRHAENESATGSRITANSPKLEDIYDH